MNDKLHFFFWLWVPILMGIAQIILENVVSPDLLAELHSETGPHEFIEFLFIFAAFLVAVFTIIKMNKQNKYLIVWVGLAAICCLYVAGEEISWGQHLLKWSTPEYWAQINDQHETNFHNTSSWLDQKPRLLLLLGVVVGGLIMPFLQKFKPGFLPKKFEIIYPPACLGVISAFALMVNLGDKISEAIQGVGIMARSSEVEELYLFYFVLLYLIILRRRILQQK